MISVNKIGVRSWVITFVETEVSGTLVYTLSDLEEAGVILKRFDGTAFTRSKVYLRSITDAISFHGTWYYSPDEYELRLDTLLIPRELRYDADADTTNNNVITYSPFPYRDENNQIITEIHTVRFEWTRPYRPDQMDEDNNVDRSSTVFQETIETGAGDDTITTGSRNDTVMAGAGDDVIDLGVSDEDQDTIKYRVSEEDGVLVAFDGGDAVKSFTPGQDKVDLSKHTSGAAGASGETSPVPFSLLSRIGDGLVVMPMLEFSPSSEDHSDLSPLLALWADYVMTGLEFHFAEAIVLPSGRLLGSIVTIDFDEDSTIRGDVLLSKAGGDFDTTMITFNSAGIVQELLEGRFADRLGSLVKLYENQPLNKPVYAVTPGAGDVVSLQAGKGDNDLFRITDDGRVWFRVRPDYEAPADGNRDNRYHTEVTTTASDGTITLTPVEVVVRDIERERYVLEHENWAASQTDAFHFGPSRIPDEHEPQGLVRHLIGGRVFLVPETGPLVLTWSINVEKSNLLKSQADIDYFRTKMERVFSEFEAAANLKFIEVGRTDNGQSGDFNIIIGAFVNLEVGSFTRGYASYPTNDISDVAYTVRSVDDAPHALLVHEIGHAMGLAHPFDERGGWPGDQAYRFSLDTIMSYASDEDYPYGEDQGLLPADIEALQFLYGAPRTNFEGVQKVLYAPAEFYYFRHDRVDENIGTDVVVNTTDIVRVTNSGAILFTDPVFSLESRIWDNDLFTFDPETVELRFRQSPDFENPHDGADDPHYGGNNTYHLVINKYYEYRYLSDPAGHVRVTDADLHYLITVEDVDETPVVPDII